MGMIDKILKKPVNDPETLYSKGEDLFKRGYYSDAIAVIEKVIAANPGHPQASLVKALALYHLGSFEEALQFFDRALEINPDLPDALVHKGLIYSTFEKHTLALNLFDRALQIHPEFIQAWYVKGLTLAAMEKYEEAILAYEKVLSLDPQNVDALSRISAALKKRDTRHRETQPSITPEIPLPASRESTVPVAISRELVQELPYPPVSAAATSPVVTAPVEIHKPQVTTRSGTSSDRAGDREPAMPVVCEENHPEPEFTSVPPSPAFRSYDATIRNLEDNEDKIPEWDRLASLGNLYLKTGKYRDAGDTFERCLEMEPRDAETWRLLGDAKRKLGIYDEAQIAYDRSLQIDSGNSAVWINRAKVLVMQSQHDEALESCDQAIRLDNSSLDAWLYKGFILKKINRNSDAIAIYHQVLKIYPGHDQASRQLRTLKGGA